MIEKFLDGHKPKLCVTDPPYGIKYSSRSTNALYSIKVKNDHIASWGDAFAASQAPVLYVWFSFHHYEVVVRAVRDADYEQKQIVIWVKNAFSLQRHLYHLQHEQCLVSIRSGSKSTELWTGDRKQKSVWHVDSVAPKKRFHPTEKPTGVYEIPIKNHTRKGDYVIDLFAGSGTIFEACQSTKRIGLGVELDPQQCDLILKRMAKNNLDITFKKNIFEKK
jgi:DNA modification methylase